jgi:hypothetical protein
MPPQDLYSVVFVTFSDEQAHPWQGRAQDHDDAKAKAFAHYGDEEWMEGLVESTPEGATDNGDYSCEVTNESALARAAKKK